jgi:hypothetical protein
MRTGRITALLSLPRSWKGDLAVVLDDTDLLVQEVYAGGIEIEARDESIEMRDVRARELAIESRDGRVALDGAAADSGRLQIRDGDVEALDLTGAWAFEARDGELSLALGPGFTAISVDSHDARIVSDFGPIRERRAVDDSGTRALALEIGGGGPAITLISHDGSIELRRR